MRKGCGLFLSSGCLSSAIKLLSSKTNRLTRASVDLQASVRSVPVDPVVPIKSVLALFPTVESGHLACLVLLARSNALGDRHFLLYLL